VGSVFSAFALCFMMRRCRLLHVCAKKAFVEATKYGVCKVTNSASSFSESKRKQVGIGSDVHAVSNVNISPITKLMPVADARLSCMVSFNERPPGAVR